MGLHYGVKRPDNFLTDLVIWLDFITPRCYSGSGSNISNLFTTSESVLNTLNIVGSPVYNSRGWFDFNASNTEGIRLNGGGDSDFINTQITTLRTYNIWFNADLMNVGNGRVLCKDGGTTNATALYTQDAGGGSYSVYAYIRNSTTTHLTVGQAGTVSLNEWYMATFVLDVPNTSLKLYIDGKLSDSGNSAFSVGSRTGNFSIAYPDNAVNDESNVAMGRHDGKISVFQMWNRAITSEEVYQLYLMYRQRYGK